MAGVNVGNTLIFARRGYTNSKWPPEGFPDVTKCSSIVNILPLDFNRFRGYTGKANVHAAGRRTSESRMRENFTYGLMRGSRGGRLGAEMRWDQAEPVLYSTILPLTRLLLARKVKGENEIR